MPHKERLGLGRSLKDLHMLVYRLFHAQRAYLRPHIVELGMGPGQPKLLVYVALNGAANQREVADFFEMDPATACRMLDSLEKSGFVRSRQGADRRRKEYAVTEAGLAAARAWEERCDDEAEVLLDGFSQEEREQFRAFLARGYANLARAARGEEGGEAR